MKIVRFFLIMLVLMLSTHFLFAREQSSEKDEGIKDIIAIFNEIKNDPHYYDVRSIDERMKSLGITYSEINSSEDEFIKLEAEGCKNSIDWLMADIRKNEITLNYIIELENLLVDCNLDYKKAGIDQKEIKKSEKWSYIALAKDAHKQYKETGNKIYLDKRDRFLTWGDVEYVNFDTIK